MPTVTEDGKFCQHHDPDRKPWIRKKKGLRSKKWKRKNKIKDSVSILAIGVVVNNLIEEKINEHFKTLFSNIGKK